MPATSRATSGAAKTASPLRMSPTTGSTKKGMAWPGLGGLGQDDGAEVLGERLHERAGQRDGCRRPADGHDGDVRGHPVLAAQQQLLDVVLGQVQG